MAKLWHPQYKDIITVDIETYDPELATLGPGVYHDPSAYVLGCAVSWRERGIKKYYPLGHTDVPLEERRRAKAELAEILATDNDKCLANAAYDLDWLENRLNLPVNGFIHDVQVAEPLLDSYSLSYSLQHLAEKYNVAGKQTVDIEKYASQIDPTHKQYKYAQQLLWLMPSKVVGEYCLGDIDATLAVLEKQLPLLAQEGLMDLYQVECDMVRLRLMMRRNGILIDRKEQMDAAHKVETMENTLTQRMFGQFGTFNINSTRQIAPILASLGVPVGVTEKGAPSVGKELLSKYENSVPFCKDLKRTRALNKLRTTFLTKSIDEHICPDGRVHCEFYPLKKDDAGTITGRWSSANPNLQQIPRNDKELGALARGMFIPDQGCWYGHTDYSQVEYRVFSHYARGYTNSDDLSIQADSMRKLFNDNPHTDYHQFVIDKVKEITGVQFDRPTAKRVNFGVLYGMKERSLSNMFNIPYEEASEVYNALLKALPFIESTSTVIQNAARMNGYVRTLGGRKQRVSPMHIKFEKYYPFFNYLIQGTAADIMKFSLRACYQEGVYDVLKLHLLVHDETGVSIPKTLQGIEAYERQQYLMGNTLKCKVPILAEADYGINWGVMLNKEGEDVFTQMRKEIS